jgi:hypothetical protein|uniref:Uncharacterized protein n=1 Tax=Zea mays TaxID=4577 RepID=B4FPK3_MAIZE|nr:unknown [Zea mays]
MTIHCFILEFDHGERNAFSYRTVLNSLFCCFLAGLLMLQLVQELMLPCMVADASAGSAADRCR